MTISAVFMRRLAEIAAAETLPRFRDAGAVANKLAEGFDPVTEADRETEQAIRRAIRSEFPEDGILGEEHGLENPASVRRWVIDPIDGTRSFISGIPLWGTLVGLTVNGDAVAGLMAQPFTREIFYTEDGQSFYEGPGHQGSGGRQRLSTRRTPDLAAATLCTTTPAYFKGPSAEAYARLEQKVRLARYGTDCYAYAMVAAGHVDLVVETGLQPYDIVALIPIIEMAGGVVTAWDGGPAEKGGAIIAAATPELHGAASAILQG
ncbi:MAG: histidinol-phosphatase [Rhizobiaceae bacterium]|nr:MAG: histidinol-phosphatase [Rhizobiaceae bacterium]